MRSGTKGEAVSSVYTDLSSLRMLPCSLGTSLKKDVDGLQCNKQRKGRRWEEHSPRPLQLLSVLAQGRLCPPRALDTPWGPCSTLHTPTHPPSPPWQRLLIPQLSPDPLLAFLLVASCQSSPFFSFLSPLTSCNNALISLLSV